MIKGYLACLVERIDKSRTLILIEIDVGLVGGDRNDLERLFPLKRVVLLAT